MKFAPSFSTLAVCLSLGAALAVTDARAQAWTNAYTSSTATGDCAGLPAALNDTNQFSIVPIVSRAIFTNPQPARAIKMGFWLNPQTQRADIFISEKGGSGSSTRILYYNASALPTPTLTVIGTIPSVYTGHAESGIWGVAVNPLTFSQDNFLYVMYARGTSAMPSATNGWRVSRFTLNPITRVMDLASEKVLLHIPAGTSGRWHTGTSLRFDNFGNLYIGLADNETTAMGAGNTADWRGGILRIKPDSSVALGYTIPVGNFGDYWAQKWQDSGLTARAATYRDTAIVKPEIYIKGSRSPYSFGVDPNRLGWIAWGECGPDVNRAEEYNFATRPAFSGWPFWAGNAVRQLAYASGYDEANEPKDAAAWAAFNPSSMTTQLPINNWAPALGVDTLPSMHAPYYTTTNTCAIGGPIVRYDGRINNPDKLPPHLDNVILAYNMSLATYATKINAGSAQTTGTTTPVFTMAKSITTPSLRYLSDFAQGPDGVLYGVEWGEACCGSRDLIATEGVVKVRYKGTCQDSGLYPPTSIKQGRELRRGAAAEWLQVGSSTFKLFTPGAHEATILDVAGRTLFTFRGEGHKIYNIPALGSGIHILRVKTSEGIVSRSLASGM